MDIFIRLTLYPRFIAFVNTMSLVPHTLGGVIFLLGIGIIIARVGEVFGVPSSLIRMSFTSGTGDIPCQTA